MALTLPETPSKPVMNPSEVTKAPLPTITSASAEFERTQVELTMDSSVWYWRPHSPSVVSWSPTKMFVPFWSLTWKYDSQQTTLLELLLQLASTTSALLAPEAAGGKKGSSDFHLYLMFMITLLLDPH